MSEFFFFALKERNTHWESVRLTVEQLKQTRVLSCNYNRSDSLTLQLLYVLYFFKCMISVLEISL